MDDPRIACETQESVEVEVEPNTAASDNSCARKHASRPSGFPVPILDVLPGPPPLQVQVGGFSEQPALATGSWTSSQRPNSLS